MIKKRNTDTGPRWDVRLRHPNGKEYARTFKSLKEAKQFEASEKTDRVRGSWIDPKAGTTLFEDWAQEWLATNQQIWRPRTYDRHEMAIIVHWSTCFKNTPLHSLTPRTIQRVIEFLSRRFSYHI